MFGNACVLPVSIHYKNFRKDFVYYINNYCDVVLAVSDRVRQICLDYGFRKDKLKVSYIGTKVAECQMGERPYETKDFTIAYLGQARHDKGFYFLIESLRLIDNEIAKDISIVLAVKLNDKKNVLDKLSHFKNVTFYNGYTHDEFEKILSNVTLGVIPVIWEDNLPQVAIEMVAHGVPILCSDAGGASELCSSPLFKFKCGDSKELKNRIEKLYLNKVLLKEYWSNHHGLVTMSQHMLDLEQYY